MTLDEYISLHTTPENEALQAITRDTHVHILNPHMLSGHVQGRALSMISHMIRPKRILELGTFTGYSALCLAEGLAKDGQLVTIEHNDELEETIRRNVGGFILADNTLWDGHIIDAAYDKDKQTLGLRAFNDRLAADERFEQVILPLRDGLTLIRKIK